MITSLPTSNFKGEGVVVYVAFLYYVVSFVHCMNMITHAQLVNEFCGIHRELCLGELLPCLRQFV